MRARDLIALVVLVAAALWWGGHQLYVGLRNRRPVEITCAEFVKHRPDAEWLRLTHCDAALNSVAYASTYNTVTKVYVPLRPEGIAEGGPTQIVVERDDAEIIEIMQAARGSTRKNPAPVEVTLKRMEAAVADPTEGLVQVGLDLSEQRQRELAKLNLGLDKDFVILERGAKPRPLAYALGALALGLAGIGWFGVLLVRRFRDDGI
jgi:hypothetical protein